MKRKTWICSILKFDFQTSDSDPRHPSAKSVMRPACDSIFTQLTSNPKKYLKNHISLAIANITMVHGAYKGKQRSHMLGVSNEIYQITGLCFIFQNIICHKNHNCLAVNVSKTCFYQQLTSSKFATPILKKIGTFKNICTWKNKLLVQTKVNYQEYLCKH